MINKNVAIEAPVMTKALFAKKVGLTEETIRGMINSKALPTVKRGKHRLINIAALTAECLQGLTKNTDQD